MSEIEEQIKEASGAIDDLLDCIKNRPVPETLAEARLYLLNAEDSIRHLCGVIQFTIAKGKKLSDSNNRLWETVRMSNALVRSSVIVIEQLAKITRDDLVAEGLRRVCKGLASIPAISSENYHSVGQ